MEFDTVYSELVLNLRVGDDAVSVITLNPPYDLMVDIDKVRSGGEDGIRTHDTVARIHTFQACSFNHSDTSPISLFYHNF